MRQRKPAVQVVGGNVNPLRRAVDVVLSTEEGRLLWAYLFNDCGYNRSVLRISRTTGDLAPLSTEAAAAQRDVYVRLRNLPTHRDLLTAAEELAEVPPVPPAAASMPQGEKKPEGGK